MQTSASLQTHKHKLGSTHGGLAHSFPSPPIPSSLWVAGKEGGSIERERLRSDTRECVLERWREAGVCCKFLNCHPSASFFLSLSLWHLLWSVSFILTLSGSSFLPFPYRYRKKARGKKMLKTARWRKEKKKEKDELLTKFLRKRVQPFQVSVPSSTNCSSALRVQTAKHRSAPAMVPRSGNKAIAGFVQLKQKLDYFGCFYWPPGYL